MNRTIYYSFAAGILLLGACTSLTTKLEASDIPQAVDAPSILRAACDRISHADGFRFFANTSIEKIYTGNRREWLSQRVDIVERRPDHLFVRVRGDIDNADLWYDGHALTKVASGGHEYSVLQRAGNIEQLVDFLNEKYNAQFPLADFLVNDVSANFLESVKASEYAGIDRSHGIDAHHLKFSQEQIDWEIWIATGEHGLPCRLQITYKSKEGAPRYVANIGGWQLHARAEDWKFAPFVPAGAKQLEFSIQPR